MYFYAYFKFSSVLFQYLRVILVIFTQVYCQKMGLPIDKLIIATNENDILYGVSGEYRPLQVKTSLSPSMDIQVASNFERLLFDIMEENDEKVSCQ